MSPSAPAPPLPPTACHPCFFSVPASTTSHQAKFNSFLGMCLPTSCPVLPSEPDQTPLPEQMTPPHSPSGLLSTHPRLALGPESSLLCFPVALGRVLLPTISSLAFPHLPLHAPHDKDLRVVLKLCQQPVNISTTGLSRFTDSTCFLPASPPNSKLSKTVSSSWLNLQDLP